MLTSLLARYGQWLLLLGIILFIIAVLNAIRAGRSTRMAYYAIRRESLTKTRRWALVAVVVAAVTTTLAFVLSSPPAETSAIANITFTPAPSVASIATKLLPTLKPSATSTMPPIVTATQAPSQTPTRIPTPTPLPNLPDILRTPIPSAVPPVSNAKLDFTTLASIIQNNDPIDPGLTFPAGTRTVRLWFRAANVNNSVVWSVLCYKDDQLVDSVVALWTWGPGTQTARAFCGLDGSAGKYRLEAYLGQTKQFEVGFLLIPATPTPTS